MTWLHSPAVIVRELIALLQLGTEPELAQPWPVYADVEPDEPDNCITVYDTAWKGDGRAMVTGETFHHFGVQVRVRAVDHATGFSKAKAIHEAFDTQVYQNRVPLDSQVYDVHNVSGTDVLSIGQDTSTSKRHIFTLNPTVAITQLQ